MTTPKQCCGTCVYLEPDPKDTSTRSGLCKWVPETAPDSFLHMRSVHMWNDDGTECPCWKPKDEPKVRMNGDSFVSMLRRLPEPKESDES